MTRRRGRTIKVEVDRVSNSGNGIAELEDDSHINLGPIKKEAVGEEIEVKMLDDYFGRPTDNSYRKDVFAIGGEDVDQSLEVGQELSIRPTRKDPNGTPIARWNGVEIEIPDEDVELGERVELRISDIWEDVDGYHAEAHPIENIDSGNEKDDSKPGESGKSEAAPEPILTRTAPQDISIGDYFSKEEVEEAFDTGFGYQISGINPRRDDQDRRYVLVFANEDGPYDDSVKQGRFQYVGEGLQGDQDETSPGNSVLIDATSSKIPVHFFYQSSDESDWEYQGLVDVLDYEFEEHDGRKVLVFTMEHQFGSETEEASQEPVADEQTSLERALEDEPQLTDKDDAYTEARRRARDTAFSELVRDAYDDTCAICGRNRETPDGTPEVEAAHIYPKRKGGSDDVRNGLALCKLHHWAFDTGWLAVSDDYEILVKDVPDKEGYYEFKQLDGDTLRLPENEDAEPHPMFLKRHREIHGF